MKGDCQLTKRKQITEFLSDTLVRTRLTGMGKHYAREVTFDYGSGKGKQIRIDFVQFMPENQYSISGIERGEFICYEIKSCIEDVLSGYGLNAEGERNYIVTTMKTYKKIVELTQKGKDVIPHGIGIMVACHNDRLSEFENPTSLSCDTDWRLEIIQPASRKYRKRSIAEMLFCMLRSGK